MSKILSTDQAEEARDFAYRQQGGDPPDDDGVQALALRDATREPAAPEPPRPERRRPLPEPPQQPAVDLDAIRAESRAAGVEEGQQQAAAALEAQWAPVLAGFSKTIQQLVTLKPELRRQTESEIVDLVFAVARRVLHREITVDPTAIQGIVRSCLDSHTNAEVHSVRVNPEDQPLLEEAITTGDLPNLKLIPDEGVERGGALFETSRGALDARIDIQLQEIANGIADAQ